MGLGGRELKDEKITKKQPMITQTQTKPGQRILVIGGDSTIGASLYHEARARGLDICRTSRRGSYSENTWHLDLGHEDSKWALAKLAQARGITGAVVALGETSMTFCANDPKASYKTNVTDTLELINALDNIGVKVTVLSSSAVFSGRAPNPTEDSACDPETEYGRQKAAIEESVMDLEGTSILRLTKVLSPNAGPWSQWIEEIREGSPVQAFGNVNLAPLRIPVVVDAILRCLQHPVNRIVHLSPPDEVTYANAVTLMADEMHLPLTLESRHAARDVNRGIFPDRWAALGSLHRNDFSHPEASATAIQMFTLGRVGLDS